MGRRLEIENILVSLPQKMVVVNEYGIDVYEAISEVGLIGASWTLYRGDDGVAKLKKGFGFKETWDVQSVMGDFKIRQQSLAFKRALEIVGGRFEGFVLHGDVIDKSFVLEHNGGVFARSESNILSIKDNRSIQILSNNEDVELLAIIGMVCVQSDHKSRKK